MKKKEIKDIGLVKEMKAKKMFSIEITRIIQGIHAMKNQKVGLFLKICHSE